MFFFCLKKSIEIWMNSEANRFSEMCFFFHSLNSIFFYLRDSSITCRFRNKYYEKILTAYRFDWKWIFLFLGHRYSHHHHGNHHSGYDGGNYMNQQLVTIWICRIDRRTFNLFATFQIIIMHMVPTMDMALAMATEVVHSELVAVATQSVDSVDSVRFI